MVELIVVIGVLAVLTIIGMGVYSHFIDKAKNTRAIAEIRGLEKEILEFWHTNDRLPDNLSELDRAVMLDPWKTPYQYINFDTAPDSEEKRRTKGNKGKGKGAGDPLNSDYDLFSMGKDKTSAPVLTDDSSKDDIVRADDGSYTGLVSEYTS
jgi:general secretion pathway protein G